MLWFESFCLQLSLAEHEEGVADILLQLLLSYRRNESQQTGSLGGAVVWRLPLAQGAILETRDPVPRRVPGAWSLLLPLPVSLPLSLSLCDYHK